MKFKMSTIILTVLMSLFLFNHSVDDTLIDTVSASLAAHQSMVLSSSSSEAPILFADGNTKGRKIAGGSDTGGNLYRGEPIENFAKTLATDSETKDAYNLLIKPLIDHLKGRALLETERFSEVRLRTLVSFLEYTFESKKWYFVPGPLPSISDDLVGIMVKTDQGALQRINRVLVDLDLWRSMKDNDARATLLLHEGIMGLKVLQFANAGTQCRAAYYRSQEKHVGADQFYLTSNTCLDQQWEPDRLITLNQGDYDDVQSMTTKAKNFSSITDAEWLEFLANKFSFNFPWFDLNDSMSYPQFKKYLETATISNKLPALGEDLNERHSLYYCDMKFTFNDNKKTMNVILNTGFEKKTRQFSFPIGESFNIVKRLNSTKKQRHTIFGFTEHTTKPGPKGGYISNHVAFFLFGDEFNIMFSENVCHTKHCQEELAGVPLKYGFNYTCRSPSIEW